jgi:hypothetical protein
LADRPYLLIFTIIKRISQRIAGTFPKQEPIDILVQGLQKIDSLQARQVWMVGFIYI